MAQWRTQGCKQEDWSMFPWNRTQRNLLIILPSSFLSTRWFIVQTIDFIHGNGWVLWQVVFVVWTLIRWYQRFVNTDWAGFTNSSYTSYSLYFFRSNSLQCLSEEVTNRLSFKMQWLGFCKFVFQFMLLKQFSAVNKFWNISETFGWADRSHDSWRGIKRLVLVRGRSFSAC